MAVTKKNTMTKVEIDAAKAAGTIVIQTNRPEDITVRDANRDVIIVRMVV